MQYLMIYAAWWRGDELPSHRKDYKTTKKLISREASSLQLGGTGLTFTPAATFPSFNCEQTSVEKAHPAVSEEKVRSPSVPAVDRRTTCQLFLSVLPVQSREECAERRPSDSV